MWGNDFVMGGILLSLFGGVSDIEIIGFCFK